jgi:glycosyltransferase involved in cell wall biosynthesis
LFGESSLVVLPYRDASQSGIVPLAFSNGRPVIVTGVGALAEAVDDEVDGIVVETPSAAAIAEAIVKALAEPGLLERLAANALVTATEGRLSMSQISRAHLDAYRAVIGSHPSSLRDSQGSCGRH